MHYLISNRQDGTTQCGIRSFKVFIPMCVKCLVSSYPLTARVGACLLSVLEPCSYYCAAAKACYHKTFHIPAQSDVQQQAVSSPRSCTDCSHCLAKQIAFVISSLPCRHTFLNMYQQFLKCFPKEDYLIDIFEYIKMSTDDILEVKKEVPANGDEETTKTECADHPLESICLGVVEARSFLFFYEEEENKENIKSSIPKGSKVQRSHSDRATSKKTYDSQRSVPGNNKDSVKNNVNIKDMPAKAKCPKIDTFNKGGGGGGVKANKVQNKFFQNVKKSQDDAIVPPLQLRRREGPANPLAKPLKAALVNAKYVTYNKVTNDLAVLFFTCGDTMLRRFYMIKMVEEFAETLGITLSSLGVDTDQFGINWQQFIQEFQQNLLYGFLIGVLLSMANTDVEELNKLIASSAHPDKQSVRGPDRSDIGKIGQTGEGDIGNRFVALCPARVVYLLDMMKDIGAYVESKDFELGLPLTNFARYQELWSMTDQGEEESGEEGEEEEEEEEEDE